MTITARYQTQCPACRQTIRPGEQVEWTRGEKARHTRCAGAQGASQAPTKPSRKTYTHCVECGSALDSWQQGRGYRKCRDCGMDGGSRYRGGQSYYDRSGNFVLGDDD